jgi:hypothetical protein
MVALNANQRESALSKKHIAQNDWHVIERFLHGTRKTRRLRHHGQIGSIADDLRSFKWLEEERRMRTMLLAVLVSALTLGSVIGVAAAEDSCRSKAIGKDGKPLAGAALSSFMTKCVRDACEPRAIDKNGKALSGAAKDSFMKKCQKEA